MDVARDAVAYRLATAREYFSVLQSAMRDSWSALFESYQSGGLPFPGSLVLLHPLWMEGVGKTVPNRRHRTFGIGIPNYERCASPEIWGYRCPFDQQLEIDHLFPWALGGPTRPENAVFLCKNHNRAKGHDVHLIPWESPSTFDWLTDEIAEIRRFGLE